MRVERKKYGLKPENPGGMTLMDYISVYTDQQALEDGVLVDITAALKSFHGKPVNRMTRALWEEFRPFLTVADIYKMSELAYLGKILSTKLSLAYYKGDIWQVPPGLWLIENELGGWTIMRPEDY